MAKNQGRNRSENFERDEYVGADQAERSRGGNKQNQQNQQNRGGAQAQGRQGGSQSQGRASGGAQGEQQQGASQAQQGPDIMGSITPVISEARNFIEGHPARAAAIGAILGGVLMTLFATPRGRSALRTAVSYANPVIAKYARDYVGKITGDLTQNALLQ